MEGLPDSTLSDFALTCALLVAQPHAQPYENASYIPFFDTRASTHMHIHACMYHRTTKLSLYRTCSWHGRYLQQEPRVHLLARQVRRLSLPLASRTPSPSFTLSTGADRSYTQVQV